MDFLLRTEFIAPPEYRQETVISGLYLDAIADVYTIYLNGKPVVREGRVQNGKVTYSRYGKKLGYPLNSNFFKEGKNILTIHIQGNPKFNLLGLFAANGYYLDYFNTVSIETRDRTGTILFFLYLFVGAYHLFLFLKRSNEGYNLFFSMISLSTFIYLISRSGIFFEYGLDSTIGYRIELLAVYTILPVFGMFFEILFFEKIGKLFKYYGIFCAMLSILTIFIPQHLIVYLLRGWQVSALICLTFYFYIFKKAIQLKSDSAKRLFVGVSILILATIFDVLDSIIFKINLGLSRFAFFSFIVGIMGILANRFINLHETVEDLNKTLEDKVERRTKELQETLTEVKLLKEQQDGDYFLTTLIIDPLASNVIGDETIDLKILIQQKKKFEFKNKIHEIGGDICISEIIYLKGKKFTAFVNGDAMGKSIQGAGGALVLGVVFKSILSRARIFSKEESVFPERWLKLAFQELQSIFESFDGSMMISVVMGLIDNERGFIYYINAEHPFCVLYRDNKASFIEKELNLRKIGIMTLEHSGNFQVNTFKLEHNDIILIGSDGRDDLKIGTDETGHRIINEDESLFLKTVEDAQGNLEEIFSITQANGELIDDFSLLRIQYKNKDSKILNEETQASLEAVEAYNAGNFGRVDTIIEKLTSENKANKTILKLRANLAYQRKIYHKAAEFYREYLDLFPEEVSFLLEAANSYSLSNDLEQAADYSERLKLREPKNLPNLILLTEIYFKLKSLSRANKTLNNAIGIDPNNSKLLELKIKYEAISTN
jgi:tetratricopeptide (TPR) repeat protein